VICGTLLRRGPLTPATVPGTQAAATRDAQAADEPPAVHF
jgi:hypothetical protein